MLDEISKNVTLSINSFERPKCLERLYKSIRKFYPYIPIIIADDSKIHADINFDNNTQHLRLPYYIGSSASRNAALDNVKTKYFVSLDDDFLFSKQTKLEYWLHTLENSMIDLVGGKVENRNYEGKIILQNRQFRLVKDNVGEEYGLKLYDVVLQFFMARTDKFRSLGGWDVRQKTQDHKLLFARHLGKLKIAYDPRVFCFHIRHMPKEYANFRHGQTEQKYLKQMMDILGVDLIEEFGVVTARR